MSLKLTDHTVCLRGGVLDTAAVNAAPAPGTGTMAEKILNDHDHGGGENLLRLKFDALASHDITYVSVIQTARASGLSEFPVPYVLTNCHNSLCAVGGTINEDDHRFGLSAARRYGGVFVPPHVAVIHQYMREMYAGGGRMILGTDSHTRYGALGTLAIGEGGGELVKQLLGRTYDIKRPEIVCVYLTGAPVPGVGPQDVALALIGATFGSGFVKNKVLEFTGPGIESLSMDFRMGVDVMTTETGCLSSIWQTDGKTAQWLALHGRADDFTRLSPDSAAYYDSAIEIDLSKVRPMIALPFHPSNVYELEQLISEPGDILSKIQRDARTELGIDIDLLSKVHGGKIYADQAVIAGCAGGGYENLFIAGEIIGDGSCGSGDFGLSIYPASQPVNLKLMEAGTAAKLAKSGATVRSCFCGPCFGAGDVPFNGAFSIRHSTRNFPNREGSRPADGQTAAVALMDARSIAATSKNGGILTPATSCMPDIDVPEYTFDGSAYESRVYSGWGNPDGSRELKFGPNIVDWPQIPALPENLLMQCASFITDPVTTTDELIPSGETSSYRSNPMRLAEFTLSRKDPGYVARAKAVSALESALSSGAATAGLSEVLALISSVPGFGGGIDPVEVGIGSFVYALKPGDGSAREQAASCQRVLGGVANIASEYATKRYRSNLINWGMLPFTLDGQANFGVGDWIFVPGIRAVVESGAELVTAWALCGGAPAELTLSLGSLTPDERRIILAGCLINDYRA